MIDGEASSFEVTLVMSLVPCFLFLIIKGKREKS